MEVNKVIVSDRVERPGLVEVGSVYSNNVGMNDSLTVNNHGIGSSTFVNSIRKDDYSKQGDFTVDQMLEEFQSNRG